MNSLWSFAEKSTRLPPMRTLLQSNKIPKRDNFENSKRVIFISTMDGKFTQFLGHFRPNFLTRLLHENLSLPQTWEDPTFVHPDAEGCKGDNDPVDVVEIGARIVPVGVSLVEGSSFRQACSMASQLDFQFLLPGSTTSQGAWYFDDD